MRTFLPIGTATAIMTVIILFDTAQPLGAHPWWSQKTLLIGAPIGLIIAAIAARSFGAKSCLLVFSLLVFIAVSIAKFGQTQFAASYAEDVLAGKLWYYGWIIVGVTFTAAITALSRAVLGVLPMGKNFG